MAHAVNTVHVHPVIDDGIDQGASRLALLAFLRGDDDIPQIHRMSAAPNASAWIRYRDHQIDREPSDDGFILRVMYQGHDGNGRNALFNVDTAEMFVNDASDAHVLDVLRDLDMLIDLVRAEHPNDYRPSEDVQSDEDAVARVMEFIAALDAMSYSDDAALLQVRGGVMLVLSDLRRVASAVR